MEMVRLGGIAFTKKNEITPTGEQMGVTQLKDDKGLKRSPIWWLIERELPFGRLRCLLLFSLSLSLLLVAVTVEEGPTIRVSLRSA